MEKKNWIIIALSLVIIILVFVKFTGDSEFETIIDEISRQRNELVRSTSIIGSELNRSIGENTQLEKDNIELRNDNTELEQIVDNLTSGSKKTKDYLTEYGTINTDFRYFIQQNEPNEQTP